MLLIDVSGVVISACLETATHVDEITEKLVRGVAFSQVLMYKKKYAKYGKPILCFDGRNYWRKDIFPNYKQNRKQTRKNSNFDWDLFFKYYNIVLDEMFDVLPYHCLKFDKTEADDIIAVLVKNTDEDIMIVSSDKDMLQLQLGRKNVKQFSPAVRKQITLKTNKYSLIEHFIRGDASDGIPNILSDDDVFLCEDKRQKSISSNMIAEAEKMSRPELICPSSEALKKYKRNIQLIDVNCIPDEIQEMILSHWNNVKDKKKPSKLRNYFIKTQQKMLYNKLEEFR
jgi:5'-3' exonuclease